MKREPSTVLSSKRWKRSVPGTRVRIEQYDIDILDVQDNMIKQVKVMPVKSLRESVAE